MENINWIVNEIDFFLNWHRNIKKNVWCSKTLQDWVKIISLRKSSNRWFKSNRSEGRKWNKSSRRWNVRSIPIPRKGTTICIARPGLVKLTASRCCCATGPTATRRTSRIGHRWTARRFTATRPRSRRSSKRELVSKPATATAAHRWAALRTTVTTKWSASSSTPKRWSTRWTAPEGRRCRPHRRTATRMWSRCSSKRELMLIRLTMMVIQHCLAPLVKVTRV